MESIARALITRIVPQDVKSLTRLSRDDFIKTLAKNFDNKFDRIYALAIQRAKREITDPKIQKRFEKEVESKKVPVLRWKATIDFVANVVPDRVSRYIDAHSTELLEGAPKLSASGNLLENPLRRCIVIEAPVPTHLTVDDVLPIQQTFLKPVAPLCRYCTGDLGRAYACRDCRKTLTRAKRTKGYSSNLFKNDLQVIYCYRKYFADFPAYLAKKKPFKQEEKPPRVKQQPSRDFELLNLPPDVERNLTRQQRRMQEYLEACKDGNVMPQQGDLTTIFWQIRNTIETTLKSSPIADVLGLILTAVASWGIANLVLDLFGLQAGAVRTLLEIAVGTVFGYFFGNFVQNLIKVIFNPPTILLHGPEAPPGHQPIPPAAFIVPPATQFRRPSDGPNGTIYAADGTPLFRPVPMERYKIKTNSSSNSTVYAQPLPRGAFANSDFRDPETADEERSFVPVNRRSLFAACDAEDDERPEPQNETEAVEVNRLEWFANVAKEVVGILGNGMQVVPTFTNDSVKTLHTCATLIRDGKTICESMQPIVETFIGFAYETLFDEPWVPWSERTVLRRMEPIVQRFEDISRDINRIVQMHSNEKYQQKIVELMDDVKLLESELSHTKVPPRYLTQVVEMRRELEHWKMSLIASRKTAKDRVEPLHVHIIGGVGTGKSTALKQLFRDLTPFLHQMYPDRVPSDFNDNMVYPRDCTADRWDGYKEQIFTILDDMFQRDDIETRRKEAMDVVRMVNPASYMLEMADLSEKGVVFFMSLVLGSSRNGDIKLSNIGLVDPGALLRRIHVLCEMLPGADLKNPGSWKFKLIEGNKDRVIDYKELLGICAGMLIYNNTVANAKPAPADWSDVKVTPAADILEMRTSLVQRARNGVGYSQAEKRANERANQKKGNKPRKQGAVFGKDDEEELEEFLSCVEDTVDFIDDYGNHVSMSLRPKNAVNDFFKRKWNVVLNTFDDALEWWSDFRHTIARKLRPLIRKARKLTTTIHIRIIELFAHVLFRCGGLVAMLLVPTLVDKALTQLSRFISEHRWGLIFGSIGLASLIGLIALGAWHYLKDDKAPAVTPLISEKEKEGLHVMSEVDPQSSEKIPRPKKDREKRVYEKKGRQGRIKGGALVWDEAIDMKLARPAYEEVKQQIESWEIDHLELYSRNEFASLCQSGDEVYRGQLFFIGGRLALTVRHVAVHYHKVKQVLLRRVFGQGDSVSNSMFVLPAPKVWLVDDSEVAFVLFDDAMHEQKVLEHHFVTDEDVESLLMYGVQEPRMIYRTRDGNRVTMSETYAEVQPYVGPLYTHDHNWVYTRTKWQTPNGSSGGIVYRADSTSARKLLASHTGASTMYAYGAFVTQELIGEAKAHFRIQKMEDPVIVPQLEITTAPVCIPRDYMEPLGTIPHGHSSSGKNPIRPSPIAEDLLAGGVLKPSTAPTIMYACDPIKNLAWLINKGLVPDPPPDTPTWVDPVVNAFGKVPPFHYVDPEILEAAWTDNDLPQIGTRAYVLLSPEEAVFGKPEIGLPPIDFTTSVGVNPEGKANFTMRKLLKMEGPYDRTKFHQWDPWLQREIIRACVAYSKGQYVLYVVVDSLKAERRKPKRVFTGDTREFCAASKVQLIVSRMFNGHLTCLEKEIRTDGTAAIGIAPTSPEWYEVTQRIKKHPNLIVTDAVNFDKHNQKRITMFLGEKIKKWFGERELIAPELDAWWRKYVANSDPCELAPEIARKLCIASCDLVHVNGSVVYRDHKTTGSGVDRTGQWNSLRNKLCIRGVFVSLARKSGMFEESLYAWDHHFDTHVAALLYGDDQAITNSDTVAEFWTPYRFSTESKELFGSTLTLPSKEPIVPETAYTPWDKFEFLKRGLRDEDGLTLAPLERSVIEDCVFWVKSKRNAYSDCAATVRSAQLEAAFHGEEYFNRVVGELERVCRLNSVPFERLSYKKVLQMAAR